MPTYFVELREVHVNMIRVESEKELTYEEAIEEALDNSVEGSLHVEYSHTLEDGHTVEDADGNPVESPFGPYFDGGSG